MISQLVITIRIWEAAVTTVDTKTKQSDGDHNFHASRLVTVACHNLYFKPRFKSSTPTLKRLVEIQVWNHIATSMFSLVSCDNHADGPMLPCRTSVIFAFSGITRQTRFTFKQENINCENRSPWPMIVFFKSIFNFAPRWEVILIHTSHDNDLDIICRCSFRCSWIFLSLFTAGWEYLHNTACLGKRALTLCVTRPCALLALTGVWRKTQKRISLFYLLAHCV